MIRQQNSHPEPRILILSQRCLNMKVYQCWMYEFEDVICDIDTVDIVEPTHLNPSISTKLLSKLSFYGGRMPGLKEILDPKQNKFLAKTLLSNITKYQVQKEYELFFVVCLSPNQLPYLHAIKGWRERCHKAVCYIAEMWEKDVEPNRGYLELLKDFDYIFLHTGSSGSSVEAVASITQSPCSFMPMGINALQSCPYPNPPHRSIDVYQMGRRSPVTHKVLLNLAQQEKKLFYLYDTVSDFSITDYQEHRSLSTNLIKRSRYFFAYKHNVNIAEGTGNQEELGRRQFEGAAGGAVMLGIPPDCLAYEQCFDWPDAVIYVPYEAANIAEILFDLDDQPERLMRVRRDNIVNSLRRHDWVYRWRSILEAVGLESTLNMASRSKDLNHLADVVMQEEIIP